MTSKVLFGKLTNFVNPENKGLVEFRKEIDIAKNTTNIGQENTGRIDYSMAIKEYAELLEIIFHYNSPIREILADAFLFVLAKHKDQFYEWKDGSQLPYAFHLCMVARSAYQFDGSPEILLLGLWHDLLEDEKATEAQIKVKLADYGPVCHNIGSFLSAVFALDRNKSSNTKEYYKKITCNEAALLVKVSDLLSNLAMALRRFEEMMQNNSRFWVYNYLFEIERYLLTDPHFQASKYFVPLKLQLDLVVKKIFANFTPSNQLEYKNWVIKQGENHGNKL